MTNRLLLVGIADLAVAFGTVMVAYQEHKQFYPTCVSLAKSSGSMIVQKLFICLGTRKFAALCFVYMWIGPTESSLWPVEANRARSK